MLTLYHNTVNKSTVKAGPISKKKAGFMPYKAAELLPAFPCVPLAENI